MKKLIPIAVTIAAVIAILEMVFIGSRVTLYLALLIGAVIGLQYIRKSLRSKKAEHSKESSKVDDSVSNPGRSAVPYQIISSAYAIILVYMIGKGLSWDLSNLSEVGSMSFGEQARVFIPILLIVLSTTFLDRNESASLKLYGWAIKNLGPGPKFIPWPIFQYTVYSRAAQQNQFPADPDKIFKGPDELPLPPNKVRALRITTGRPVVVKGDKNPLNIQMAVEFIYYLRVEIYDPLTFEVKYGNLEGFWEAVRDTGDKLLNAKVTQMAGVSMLIENTEMLMQQLHQALNTLCHKGGVTVIESGISAPDLTHALSSALRNIGVVRAEAGAEAGRITQVKTAEAEMAALMITKTSRALEEASPAAQAAYVGKQVLSDKTTFLGTEALTQALGMAKHLTDGIKKGDVKDE